MARTTGEPVLLLSPDPDFSQLLVFLLSYHGISVSVAAYLPPPLAGRAPPGLLLLDCTAGAPLWATSAASWAGCTPAIVLARPEALPPLQAVLPAAVAFLPVPVAPRQLVTLVRRWVAAPAPQHRGVYSAPEAS